MTRADKKLLFSLLGILVALLLLSATTKAQDFSVNVGAIEVLAVPDGVHLGTYPYLGGSLVIPTKHVALIPGLSVEWSPEFGHWGFVGTFIVDYALTSRVGLDFNLAMIHDQAGNDWKSAVFFLGAGPGVSFFINQWTISPSLCVFHGVNVPGWSLVPGLNISYLL